MPPDPRVHVGVAAVVEHDERLLMVRRGGTEGHAADGHGTWCVPGGWLEFGETPYQAAAREVLEETAVVVDAVYDDGVVSNISGDGSFQIVTLFVHCRYVAGEATVMEPEKCPEVAWVLLDDVRSLPLFAPLETWWPR